jgi:predicted amidohydrolase YtcJ
MLQCSLHEVAPTVAAYVEAIAAYAADHPDLAWVRGEGWSMAAFPGGTPRRDDLDRAVPDRPAYFENRDGHGAWANSRALELAGVDRDTPDPVDGRIERDADGTPSGTLHEGAMRLVERLIPPPAEEDVLLGLANAQAYLHSLGITAWQDASVSPSDLAAYRTFVGRGLLTGRAIAAQRWNDERGAEQVDEMIGDRQISALGRLRATSVKIFLDGVIENYSAAMLDPYLDRAGRPTSNRGHSNVDPDALKGYVTRLDAEGFQVHFHALGDRAVREGLDAIEAARTTNGPTDGRHHLAHLQVVDPADIPRFRALGATATIQALWACLEPQMTVLTIPFLGPERAARQYPFASLKRAGARLAGGSDWAVSTPDVLKQAEVAITRMDRDAADRVPLGPGEALDLMDMLAAFTIGSAYVNHLDDETGTVEVGKLADLTILDRDIEAEEPGRVGDANVLLTLVEGQAVHDAGVL